VPWLCLGILVSRLCAFQPGRAAQQTGWVWRQSLRSTCQRRALPRGGWHTQSPPRGDARRAVWVWRQSLRGACQCRALARGDPTYSISSSEGCPHSVAFRRIGQGGSILGLEKVIGGVSPFTNPPLPTSAGSVPASLEGIAVARSTKASSLSDFPGRSPDQEPTQSINLARVSP
jgi:hypothetical protein